MTALAACFAPGASWDEARPDDDQEVRSLLRACPMDGLIRVALTREPDTALSASIEGTRHRTFVVRDHERGGLRGMGARSVRNVWLDGNAAKLGYLGQLRAAPGAIGPRRLMEGYRTFESAWQEDELAFDLTAIAEDNEPARRLLERGLPGLPRYERIGVIETLVIATGGRREQRVRAAVPGEERRVLDFVDQQLHGCALAPRWDEAQRNRESLRGLDARDFLLLEVDGELAATAAIWDQRAFKQVVVDGYRPWLAFARPIVNVALRARGEPLLPPPGSKLAMAYLSHLAVAADDRAVAEAIVRAASLAAKRRGIDTLAFALADGHPLHAPLVRKLAPRRYRSILYAVSWTSRPIKHATLESLRSGRIHVEAATL